MPDQHASNSKLKQVIALLLLGVVLVFAIINRLAAPDQHAAPAPQPQAQTAPAADQEVAVGGHDEVAEVVDDAGQEADTQASVSDTAGHGQTELAGPVEQGVGEHGEANAEAGEHAEHHAVPNVGWWWILPFALLLGSIAVCPLINMHFWEHHYPKFAIVLGLITAIYYLFLYPELADSRHAWSHEMKEYVSFIALLGSLYIVSGGIMINVSRKATATTNTVLLLVGAIVANVFGTTGAAMLLIRPYIRINKNHIKPYHIVFFIFAVANCGGSLSPIGDPPLFMGYLKGVPFFWVTEALWPMWIVCLAVLLTLFFIIDKRDHAKVEREHEKDPGPAVQIYGFQNFLYIGLILAGVFRPSMFQTIEEGHAWLLPISREVMMLIASVASVLSTKPFIHERNEFNYGPIKEVAILFVGIFSTMVPALNYLNIHSEQMPLKSPGQYYYLTGALSSCLDNAPTYLVFLETKQGQVQSEYGEPIEQLRAVLDDHQPGQLPDRPVHMEGHVLSAYDTLVKYNSSKIMQSKVTDSDIRIAMIIGNPDLALYLMAISVGAVFFGACTYIGNGPNFMVKAIAESAGIKMPSFFGYVLRYALPILIPTYVVVWLLFFVLKLGM